MHRIKQKIKQKLANIYWKRKLRRYNHIYIRTIFVREHKTAIDDYATIMIYNYPEYYTGKKSYKDLTEDIILQAKLDFHDEFVDAIAEKLNVLLFEEGESPWG